MTSERFLSSAVQCIHTKESKARKEYNLEKKKKKGHQTIGCENQNGEMDSVSLPKLMQHRIA